MLHCNDICNTGQKMYHMGEYGSLVMKDERGDPRYVGVSRREECGVMIREGGERGEWRGEMFEWRCDLRDRI